MHRLLVLAAASLFVAACAGDEDAVTAGAEPDRVPPATSPATDSSAAVPADTAPSDQPVLTLHVSNQSFADSEVGIVVEIGGARIVDESFAVENQHSWKTFTVDLPPGDHQLRAESSTGVTIEETVTIVAGERLWAVLSYWWYPEDEPRHFTVSTSDQPVAFG